MVCYEAGCFGYEPARRMQAMGAEVYVIAPQDWDEQGKRQVNDQFDAQVMCRRLSEYLGGHRRRSAWCAFLRPRRRHDAPRGGCASNCGGRSAHAGDGAQPFVATRDGAPRALVVSRQLAAHCGADAFLGHRAARGLEEIHRADREPGVREGSATCRGRAAATLRLGEGELTHELIARELFDPQRFKNGRQVGNYFGLCPSESSSGAAPPGFDHQAWQPALRRLMVELAWRVSRFQPQLSSGSPMGPSAQNPKPPPRPARKPSWRWPAAVGGPVADRHRASEGRRTGPCSKE